jgi:hypothetical protein
MLKNYKFAFEGNKSKMVRRTVLAYKSGPHFKKVWETLLYEVIQQYRGCFLCGPCEAYITAVVAEATRKWVDSLVVM